VLIRTAWFHSSFLDALPSICLKRRWPESIGASSGWGSVAPGAGGAAARRPRPDLPTRQTIAPGRVSPARQPVALSGNRTVVLFLAAVPSTCPCQRARAVTTGQPRYTGYRPWPRHSASMQDRPLFSAHPSKLVTSGATFGATFHPTDTDNSGHWRSTDPAAQPALSVIIAGRPSTRVLSHGGGRLGPRSALGPCRNGRARASAVTHGRQRFGRTAGHRPSRSSSRDDAEGRFGLWSRRSR
jgi:hypothetical protein